MAPFSTRDLEPSVHLRNNLRDLRNLQTLSAVRAPSGLAMTHQCELRCRRP